MNLALCNSPWRSLKNWQIVPAVKDSFVGEPKLLINQLENFRRKGIAEHSLMYFMLYVCEVEGGKFEKCWLKFPQGLSS